RLEWLDDRLANILGKSNRKRAGALGRRTGPKTTPAAAPRAVPKAAPQAAANAAIKAVTQPARRGVAPTAIAPPAPAAARPAAGAAAEPAPLPRIDIDIPFTAEFDLAPLLAAAKRQPDHDGAWHMLRERFAHLGLAQGFDELLCLPHLNG